MSIPSTHRLMASLGGARDCSVVLVTLFLQCRAGLSAVFARFVEAVCRM